MIVLVTRFESWYKTHPCDCVGGMVFHNPLKLEFILIILLTRCIFAYYRPRTQTIDSFLPLVRAPPSSVKQNSFIRVAPLLHWSVVGFDITPDDGQIPIPSHPAMAWPRWSRLSNIMYLCLPCPVELISVGLQPALVTAPQPAARKPEHAAIPPDGHLWFFLRVSSM